MVNHYEMIDGGEGNVYHFLFIMVANFLIANVDEDLVYYYPNKTNCKVSEGFLALLPKHFHRQYEKQPNIQYISFMHAIPIFHDTSLPESYFLIRKLFGHACSKQIVKGKRIYILRISPARSLYNEFQVSNLMRSYGFEIVQLEQHSISEQIRMFSEAELVCGAHGAGLAFTVFCNSGVKIIEILGSPITQLRHYIHLAHVLQFPFCRFDGVVMCDKENNMFVDTDRLEHCLQEFGGLTTYIEK